MNRILITFLFFLSILGACSTPQSTYMPERYMSNEQQNAFMYDIARYIGRLPKKASHDNKFEARFDAFYRSLAEEHRLEKLYMDESGQLYFMVSRIAPSMQQKRVAIAGRLMRNEQGAITYYEEVFRTWKMPEEELESKSAMLFDRLVKGQELLAYLPQNSGEEEYIEFPDNSTYFDTDSRRWQLQ